MKVTFLHPRASAENLGLLPMILQDRDPRPLREQIEDRYRNGGGWNELEGPFEVQADKSLKSLKYPEDRPFIAILEMSFPNHPEVCTLYTSDIVRIAKPDGSFVVIRMD